MELLAAVQIVGLLIGMVTVGGVLIKVGQFAERTTTGVTTELKHLNTSMDSLRDSVDGVRADLGEATGLIHSALERIAKLEAKVP